MSLCTAKCLAHYKNLYTFELTYPRYIHSEFMTHRMFSRNACSSRAIPVEKLIADVRDKGVMPEKVYMNKAGMVGGAEADEVTSTAFKVLWEEAAENACKTAEMMKNLGIHKQHINRILEPFQLMRTIVTATEWDNFFKLRMAPDAQPEMQELANVIYDEMNRVGDEVIGVYFLSHDRSMAVSLPYVLKEEVEKYCNLRTCEFKGDNRLSLLLSISSARCARVSYNNHDGTKPDIEKDLKLANEILIPNGHLSPTEHPCMYNEGFSNINFFNLRGGWASYRYYVETR